MPDRYSPNVSLPSHLNKIFKFFHLGQHLVSDQKWVLHFQMRNMASDLAVLILISTTLHLPAKEVVLSRNQHMMKPMEAHRMQKAEMRL